MMQPSNFITPGLLRYVEGDATVPISAGHRLIIHVCNDIGKWGSGFVLALSKRWAKTKEEYKMWYISQNNFKLGEVQEVSVQSDTIVVNMIAQHGIGKDEDGNPPIRYDALEKCLDQVGELACDYRSRIHGPRFGADRACGDWEKIEKLIKERLIKRGINVTIYDLPEE
jgi:O-acetyl-ADP-ribose deacetylase (regulator of RNase III)